MKNKLIKLTIIIVLLTSVVLLGTRLTNVKNEKIIINNDEMQDYISFCEILYINYDSYIEETEFDMTKFESNNISDYLDFLEYNNSNLSINLLDSFLELENEEEKLRYFSRLVIKRKVLNKYTDYDFEEYLNISVDEYASLYIEGDIDNYIQETIEIVAKNKGVSYYECVNNAFKTFLIYDEVNQLYPEKLSKKILGISSVDLINSGTDREIELEHWSNAKEYYNFVQNKINEYNNYFDEIYNQSNIVVK